MICTLQHPAHIEERCSHVGCTIHGCRNNRLERIVAANGVVSYRFFWPHHKMYKR